MFKETKYRTLVKGISWRILATVATIFIVYLFFGRFDLAIAAGFIETLVKIFLYFLHERVWLKVKFGKERIVPFNLWFIGVPMSGKTTIGDIVYNNLKKNFDYPIERIDSKDIRDLIPEIGYERTEREMHIKRVGYLIRTLQKNSISVVASFVSPYETTRDAINKMTTNAVFVYLKTDIETCKKRDYKGLYKLAEEGKLKNFTGVSDVFEEPVSPDLLIDTDVVQPEVAANEIIQYLKKKYLK